MTIEQTLGELVTTAPAAAKVLHEHGLDFCCGGKQTLEQACREGGLDPEAVLREVEKASADHQAQVRWDERPIAELVEHILARYHTPLRTELPRLILLALKVERVHADKPDRPAGLAGLLTDVRMAVDLHLAKEEQILFPLILSGRGNRAHMPIQVLTQEHEDHGDSLRRIRALANDFQLPEHACTGWRELYRSLAELEADLMEHIHLENNVLFPRTLAG